MPKYVATVVETVTHKGVVVDADDRDSAENEAESAVVSDPDTYYFGTDREVAELRELTRYECVIFIQNADEYAEFERIMYPGSTHIVVNTSDPQEPAALAHLRQWDYGEPVGNDYVQWDSPADGPGVRSHSADGYLMVWHVGLGWAALYRVVEGATP